MKTWESIVLGLGLMMALCSFAGAESTVGGKPAPSQTAEDTQTSITALTADVTSLTADVAVLDTKADDSATSQTDILAEITEVEEHFHNVERWLGDSASSATMTCYVATSGADTYGVWLPLLTGSDTPIIAGKTKFDLHEFIVCDVTSANITRLQIGWDATTTTLIVSSNQFSEVMFVPTGIGANVAAAPTPIRMPRLSAGTLVWARFWVDGQTGDEIDFFVGVHEYLE